MGQPITTIHVDPDTTPDGAVDMAYGFAVFLRNTGWKAGDEDFARSLWIKREYGASPLLPYLTAGFAAGYSRRVKPSADQIPARVAMPAVRPKPRAVRPSPTR